MFISSNIHNFRGVYHGLEKSSQTKSLIPLRKRKYMGFNSYGPVQFPAEYGNTFDPSSNYSHNGNVDYETRTQNKSKNPNIIINPTKIIPENRETFPIRTVNL
jgi:hypothetical protein